MTTKRELIAGARARSQGPARTFVNLRVGTIAETNKSQLPGMVPLKTKNASGTESHFFGTLYADLTGFVTNLQWHSHTFQGGGEQMGWNVTIDTPDRVFVLFVGAMDRSYDHLMSCLLNVEFDRLVMFRGFETEWPENSGKMQKNLLLSQDLHETETDKQGNPKPIWIQGAYQQKWMSLILRDKLKNGEALDERDRKNVHFDVDGNPDNTYPYILQRATGKWSFDAWEDFLVQKMKSDVIPAIEEANERRGPNPFGEQDHTPEYSGGPVERAEAAAIAGHEPVAAVPPEDDIPF